MIPKVLLTATLFILAISTLTAQEKTTYRGDTTMYASLRKKIVLVSDSIKKAPNDKRLYFTRAYLLNDVERWADAEADLTRAIALDSTEYNYYYKRGAVRQRLNKASDAYIDFTEVIRLNPSFEWAYLDRGIILQYLKLFKEAEKDFRTALVIKPNWANALFNLGMNHNDQGAVDSALYYYKQAILFDSTEYKAHNNIGNIYSKQGKFDLAIQYFDKALAIWDKYEVALINRANARMNKKDKAGACADLQRLIQLGRQDVAQYYKKYCE
jgi:tetratricopeptide (TPR) repeat protein